MIVRYRQAFRLKSLRNQNLRITVSVAVSSTDMVPPQLACRFFSSAKVPKRDSSSHACQPDDPHDENYFRYTRGRFVSNEQNEMSLRYVRFNMHELARIAANAVGSESCVSIEKYPDGMYNKAFLLTMDDGKRAVAKVPNPNAGRPHFTTSSEVATMDFVRTKLGTPIPKVFAWCSRADQGPVGAEYIIMERAPGIQLSSVWAEMGIEDRFQIVKNIARLQKTWMTCSFHQYGSLYYSKDVDRSVQGPLYTDRDGVEVMEPMYAVGPSTGRGFHDDGRFTIEFDRGPWSTLERYESALAHREASCVKKMSGLPKSPITLCGPGTYQPTREKKLKALDCYLTLVEHLLPTDSSIGSSCLLHGDLHIDNIFVAREEPTRVVGIIDWQSTELAPLFEHAHQPYFLDHDGPAMVGLERPQLPDDMAQLDPAAQKQAKALYLHQSLSALYKALLHRQNPRFYSAMDFTDTPSFDLLILARNLLVDGEATYLARVVDLEETWAELPGVRAHGIKPFPFHFTDEERAVIEADFIGSLRGMEAMRCVKASLGELFPQRGIVRHDQYEASRNALQRVRDQTIEKYASSEDEKKAWRENWPFDD